MNIAIFEPQPGQTDLAVACPKGLCSRFNEEMRRRQMKPSRSFTGTDADLFIFDYQAIRPTVEEVGRSIERIDQQGA